MSGHVTKYFLNGRVEYWREHKKAVGILRCFLSTPNFCLAIVLYFNSWIPVFKMFHDFDYSTNI